MEAATTITPDTLPTMTQHITRMGLIIKNPTPTTLMDTTPTTLLTIQMRAMIPTHTTPTHTTPTHTTTPTTNGVMNGPSTQMKNQDAVTITTASQAKHSGFDQRSTTMKTSVHVWT